MTTHLASCGLCSTPIYPEHYDLAPLRLYCASCAGCDAAGDPLSSEAMCDACARARRSVCWDCNQPEQTLDVENRCAPCAGAHDADVATFLTLVSGVAR